MLLNRSITLHIINIKIFLINVVPIRQNELPRNKYALWSTSYTKIL